MTQSPRKSHLATRRGSAVIPVSSGGVDSVRREDSDQEPAGRPCRNSSRTEWSPCSRNSTANGKAQLAAADLVSAVGLQDFPVGLLDLVPDVKEDPSAAEIVNKPVRQNVRPTVNLKAWAG